MQWLIPAAIFVCAAGISILATGTAASYLRHRNILDHPNSRSSHQTPIPRGGGLAVVPLVLFLWLVLPLMGVGADRLPTPLFVPLVVAVLLIAIVSWVDDLKGLSQIVRLVSHIVAIGAILVVLPVEKLYFQGLLPPWADKLVAGLIWLWFVNLFNFMDGIDGISGVETISICIGIALVVGGTVGVSGLGGLALAVGGTAAGFLLWNWQPAKIFLGDVGAVPLGFVLGWLLLELAAAGAWAAALILPLYYFSDATITLCRRAICGEKFWQAHRQHFYQQAANGGMSHARISIMIAVANIGLIAMAWNAANSANVSIIGALIITAALLLVMRCGGMAK